MCRRLAHVEADRCAVMRRHAALLRLDAVWGHQESGDGLVYLKYKQPTIAQA